MAQAKANDQCQTQYILFHVTNSSQRFDDVGAACADSVFAASYFLASWQHGASGRHFLWTFGSFVPVSAVHPVSVAAFAAVRFSFGLDCCFDSADSGPEADFSADVDREPNYNVCDRQRDNCEGNSYSSQWLVRTASEIAE